MKTKHFLIITFSLLLSIVCRAQIDKGDKQIGGSINFISRQFSNEGIYNSNNTSLFFNGIYGKAVKKNQVNGISISTGFSKQPLNNFDSAGNISLRSKNFTSYIGVFKRRYFPLGKNFYFFGQVGADIAYGQDTYDLYYPSNTPDKNVNRSYGINAYLYPGFSYQVSKSFMLDLSLGSLVNIGYSHTTRSFNNQAIKPQINTLYLNSNLSLSSLGDVSVGFRVLFHNKKSNKKTGS